MNNVYNFHKPVAQEGRGLPLLRTSAWACATATSAAEAACVCSRRLLQTARLLLGRFHHGAAQRLPALGCQHGHLDHVSRPAARASSLTACTFPEWLSRSASPFASRGTATPSHCAANSRKCRSHHRAHLCHSARCGVDRRDRWRAVSLIEITARAGATCASAVARAIAHMANNSATCIDSRSSCISAVPAASAAAACSACVVALRVRAPCTSLGHFSDTTHTRCGESAANA
eukprot:6212222-Pleurochrysis_carterae.AAC.3